MGRATPLMVKTFPKWSGHLSILTAVITPMGTDKIKEIRIESTASSKVIGNRFLISSITGTPRYQNDSPKSPLTTPQIHLPYWV